MNEYSVEARFPEVTAHRADQVTSVRATRIDLAAARGLRILRERAGVKKKRIRTVSLIVRFIRKIPKEDAA